MDGPLGALHDGDASDEWVDVWSASITERAERAQALADRVASMSVSASGAGGAVVATVAGSGVLTDLKLDERVLRWPPDRIAGEVLATMRRAQGMLAGKVAEAAAETVGEDTETARAVVSSFEQRFPAQPPDDADARGEGRGRGGR